MHLIDKDIYYAFKRFCCPLPANLNGNNNNNFDMFEQLWVACLTWMQKLHYTRFKPYTYQQNQSAQQNKSNLWKVKESINIK